MRGIVSSNQSHRYFYPMDSNGETQNVVENFNQVQPHSQAYSQPQSDDEEAQAQSFMVPQSEFENLKALTLKIESEACETIQKKDAFIEQMRAEMQEMSEQHKIDLDEHRLQSEIRITDLEQKVKRQDERLAIFEANAEF